MTAESLAGSAGRDALATEAARSLFSKFRALLDANTAALGTMAAMERMLGGDYIFDRAVLEKYAREVTDLAHQAVYAVNAMTGNRHVALYDRFMALAAAVEDILAGRPGSDDARLVRPLGRLRLEDRPKVGQEAAALGELAGRLGLPVTPGFAVAGDAWLQGRLTDRGQAAVASFMGDPEERPKAAVLTISVAMRDATAGTTRQERRGVPATPEAVLAALDGAAKGAMAACAGPVETVRTTALVLATPPAVWRGRLRTRWRDADGRDCLRLDLWLDDDPSRTDALYLDPAHPFALRGGTLVSGPGDRRPSSAVLSSLAGQAVAAERLLGAPVALGFCLEASGRVVFDAVRRLLPEVEAQTPLVTPPSEELLRGGEAACLGAASGQVVPVDETTPVSAVPFGAIAVTRSASPALAPLLRRAGAVVAEVGDAAGHLAAMAREYRVPALFGLSGALAALPRGLVVTVDAEAGRVTRGASPVRPVADGGLSPDDPEYLTLRRLLRRIVVLHLTDPAAPDFSAEGCRTLHDVLHFAHDRAVAVLADLRQTGVREQVARPLPLPIPLDLRVLDLGGALVPGAKGLAAVRSRPLAALLGGMLAPGMWDTTPAAVGLGEILGAMAKTVPDTGGNLAIAASAYCNVSLRLGYHFTVIDAYLGHHPEKNSIYLRFAGGLGNAAGRAARAAFVRRVLARYEFKAEGDGDLVVARLKLIEPGTAEEALALVGSLCAFARQRDTGPADADSLETAFFAALAASRGQIGRGS